MSSELHPFHVKPADENYLQVRGSDQVRQRSARYLSDESRLAPETDAAPVCVVHFPETMPQVVAALVAARRQGHRVAVSGGRTGITGGAVPVGCQEVISLERLTHRPVLRRDERGRWRVRVGAGTTVHELDEALRHGMFACEGDPPQHPLFYPVDTTEGSAQIGGTIATDASGARTLYYGSTRKWVQWLQIVLADGCVLEVERGQVRAEDDLLTILTPHAGRQRIPVPDLPAPAAKHTAGYFLRHDMDAIDLFIGSEGTLGVITAAELLLAPRPRNCLYLTVLLDGEDSALELARTLGETDQLQPVALEYFGPRAMDLLRGNRADAHSSTVVPVLGEDFRTALYTEFVFSDETHLDRLHGRLLEVFRSLNMDPDNTWAGFSPRDEERMKRMRHAVPEAVNAVIGRRKRQHPEIHKVGTDMAVPAPALTAMMQFYRHRLEEAALDYVIFGHIGNGHLHVNVMPEAGDQMELSGAIYLEFAREAVRLGGSVAGEHGIGRIKKPLLHIQYSDRQLAAMRRVKDAFDPEGMLNPGVLFD